MGGGATPPKGRGVAFCHSFPHLVHTLSCHGAALSLTERIAAFLDPKRGAVRELEGNLANLRGRLEELEAHQLAHDVAWTEAKDQISRHLKRVAAIEQRSGKATAADEVTRRVLELKLGKGAS